MSSGQSYNWEMTGAPDAAAVASDPQAAQSWNQFVQSGNAPNDAQQITPQSYDQQVALAQSWGVPQDQMASIVGTPESVAASNQAQASNLYNTYGFTPTWANDVGYSISPEQQASAIKSSGLNFNPTLSSNPSSDNPIVSAYNTILGRDPTPAEVAAGMAKMGADNLGFPTLISDLSTSAEAKNLLNKGVISQSTLDQANKNLPSAYGYLYPRTSESFLNSVGNTLGDVVKYGVPAVMAVAGGAQMLGADLGGAATTGATTGGLDAGTFSGPGFQLGNEATLVPSSISSAANTASTLPSLTDPSLTASLTGNAVLPSTNTAAVNFAPGVSDAIGYVPSSTVEAIASGASNVPGVATGTALPTEFGFNPALPETGSLGGTSVGFNSSLAPQSILGSGLGSGGEIGSSYLLGANGEPATDMFGNLIKASSVGFGGYPAASSLLDFLPSLSSLLTPLGSLAGKAASSLLPKLLGGNSNSAAKLPTYGSGAGGAPTNPGLANLAPGLTHADLNYILAGLGGATPAVNPVHAATGGLMSSATNANDNTSNSSANNNSNSLNSALTTRDNTYALSGIVPLGKATGGSASTADLFDSKGAYNYANVSDAKLAAAVTKPKLDYTLSGLHTLNKANGGSIHTPEFYSEGGASLENRYVTGEGDGTSDSIPAMLANGEFVIPADVVSGLGNGSNDSGAKVLDEFLRVIRQHKQKHDVKRLPPNSKGPLAYLTDAKRKVKN